MLALPSSVFVVLLVVPLACATTLQQSPGPNVPEGLPVLNVRLLPPRRPHPRVVAEIGVLDEERGETEGLMYEALDKAYNDTISNAEAAIAAIVDEAVSSNPRAAISYSTPHLHGTHLRGLSMLEQDAPPAFAVKLRLYDAETMPQEVMPMMKNMERKRNLLEKSLFREACREFAGLTQIVMHELRTRLSEMISTLRTPRMQHIHDRAGATSFVSARERISRDSEVALPGQVEVRMSIREKWPKISELVEDMERRRDRSEDQVRSRILELELRLLKAENEMAAEALGAAAQSLRAAV